MPYLLVLTYGQEHEYEDDTNHCSFCFPLAGRIYVPGHEPELPLHPACTCLYTTVNLGDPDSEEDHIHQDLIDQIHDLNITELQQQLLDLAARLQDLAERVCVNTYA
jgi:hypothetical protein